MDADKYAENRRLAKEIGRRIRREREKAGLSQHALAELIQIRQTEVHRYEVGERLIGLVNLTRMARHLACPIQDLLPVESRELVQAAAGVR